MPRATTKPLWVLLLSAACAAGQTVEGHVVDSTTGAGIPGVAVGLIPALNWPPVYSTTTDAHGSFRIEGVKDGSYSATYKAPGFFPIPNGPGWLPVQVASGVEPTHLEAKMQPIGKISGRVLDGTGKPVSGATLWLQWESNECKSPWCLRSPHKARTDEKGEYSVADLDSPGAWLLSATAPASWPQPEPQEDRRLGWAQTFYPGVTDPQLATRAMTGSELWLDIKLAAVPVHRIRGVALDVNGDPAPNTAVTLGKGIGSPSLHEDTKADGTFEFESVTDDDWQMATKADQRGLKLFAAREVQINGHDVENVELRLAAPFSIRGRIVMEGPDSVPAPAPGSPKALPKVFPNVILDSSATLLGLGDAPGGDAIPDANGNFTIPNLYAGGYQILVPGAQPPYYLDSIRLGDRDALGLDVPILSAAQPLIITYKPNGGTVSGTVDKCASGAVALVPQDTALRRPGTTRFVPCDSNGRYTFPALRPGEYYALAVAGDSGATGFTTFDDALLKQASSVTVRAGETSSVDLRAIAWTAH
jgi:hypothetical protein